MRRALLIGFCAAACIAQSPGGPDISAYYRMHVGDAPLYKWLRVDAPLTVTVDAAGAPHLGISLIGVYDNCIIDANRNMFCTGKVQAGTGIIALNSADGGHTQISIDTATVPTRLMGTAPSPGPCSGSAGYFPDTTGTYYCVPNPTGGYVWMKTSGTTAW